MTITISDPELIEKLSSVDEAVTFVRPDGSVIRKVEALPQSRMRFSEMSPFTEEELSRRRAEIGDNPAGRRWEEIRKELESRE